jgi:hypothetical protein
MVAIIASPDSSIEFKSYRCFKSESFTGFQDMARLNILIGRNNSGKSAALHVIRLSTQISGNPDANKVLGDSIIRIDGQITEDIIRANFQENTRGGGLPGENHLAFARPMIGKRMSVTYQSGRPPQIESLPTGFERYKNEANFVNLARSFRTPLQGRIVAEVSAERDIQSETDNGLGLSASGGGATSTIQAIQNKAKYNQRLISQTLLEELNSIVAPDAQFSSLVARQLESNHWEVFLEEKDKGLVPLSASGSGLKTIILVLLQLVIIPAAQGQNLSNYV